MSFRLLGLAVLPLFGGDVLGSASYREPAVTQPGRIEWAWDGGKRLAVGVPATVHYSEQGAPRVVITGPDELLRRVRFGDGNITMDNDDISSGGNHEQAGHHRHRRGAGRIRRLGQRQDACWASSSAIRCPSLVSGSGSAELDAVVKGDADLRVSGSGHITFAGLEARNLNAHISGSGGIDGKGHVDMLDLDMSGSGRFADIAASRADVTMSGSGRAMIAARDEAHVRISGSATVRMPASPPSWM